MTITFSEALDEPEKLSRARNLFETQEGSLFYFQSWGVDKDITSGKLNIDLESLRAYFRQKAASYSMQLDDVSAVNADFEMLLTFEVV